jgi:glycosyltransferase involved in cell wall biosynthesis
MAEPIRSGPEVGFMVSRAPLISVIMTSYNYRRYIEESVKSVWEQSYPNLELVVVDDASSDGTPAFLEELRKRSPIPMRVYLNTDNRGPNWTQNRAVTSAQGEFITFLASDDKFAPRRFESQVRSFNQDPELMIAYGNGWSFKGRDRVARLHGEDVKRLLSQGADQILRYLYTHSSPLYLQTALVKREFLIECGGNDEQVLADDWVLNIRFFQFLAKAGHFAYIDEDLAYYRLHDDNLHKNFARQIALKREVIERYTPKSLRREALANIYKKQAGIALAQGKFLSVMNSLVLSKVYVFLSKRPFREAS